MIWAQHLFISFHFLFFFTIARPTASTQSTHHFSLHRALIFGSCTTHDQPPLTLSANSKPTHQPPATISFLTVDVGFQIHINGSLCFTPQKNSASSFPQPSPWKKRLASPQFLLAPLIPWLTSFASQATAHPTTPLASQTPSSGRVNPLHPTASTLPPEHHQQLHDLTTTSSNLLRPPHCPYDPITVRWTQMEPPRPLLQFPPPEPHLSLCAFIWTFTNVPRVCPNVVEPPPPRPTAPSPEQQRLRAPDVGSLLQTRIQVSNTSLDVVVACSCFLALYMLVLYLFILFLPSPASVFFSGDGSPVETALHRDRQLPTLWIIIKRSLDFVHLI